VTDEDLTRDSRCYGLAKNSSVIIKVIGKYLALFRAALSLLPTIETRLVLQKACDIQDCFIEARSEKYANVVSLIFQVELM